MAISHLSRLKRAAPSVSQKVSQFGQRNMGLNVIYPWNLRRRWSNTRIDRQIQDSRHPHYLKMERVSRMTQISGDWKRTLVLFLDEGVHVNWGDTVEEFYVIVRMKLCHFPLRGGLSTLGDANMVRQAG